MKKGPSHRFCKNVARRRHKGVIMHFFSLPNWFLNPVRAAAVVATLILLPVAPVRVLRAALPDDITATDILRTVREAQAGRHEALDAQLRTGDGKTLPFRLTANGPIVRYAFPGPPPTTIQVRYNEDNSQLEESSGAGPSERLTPANFDKTVLGTGLTYEDLALRFVYWKRAKLLEGDDTTTFPSYKMRLDPPSRQSQYSYILLWVAKSSGALAQVEGYNLNGKLSKRLQVVDIQKIDGKWYLKRLRIEELNPETGRTLSRSYLEVKGIARSATPVH
jgi:hypothetical protein